MKKRVNDCECTPLGRHGLSEIWRCFRKNKAAVIGLVIFLAFVLVAVFADLIIPYDMAVTQVSSDRLMKPCAEHLLGTDTYGRDMLARIAHGARRSLSIGIVTSIFTLVIGGIVGSMAAYFGGIYDNIIMRIMDVFQCIPFMLLAIAIVSALGSSMVNLLIAMIISTTPSTIRLVRSCTLSVVDQDYIEAAKAYGSSNFRIIVKHVLPNAIGPIIVNTTMGMADTLLAAAGLSFIGLGVQSPTPEWGSMLSSARDYMLSSPFLLYIPGAAILLAVLAINLVGDGLRDALDPKLKD